MFLAEKYKPLTTRSNGAYVCSTFMELQSEVNLLRFRAQAEVCAYLVGTGKILDKEAEKDSGEQPASHLQGSSQHVVPGRTLKNQPRTRTTQSVQKIYRQEPCCFLSA